MHELRVLGGRHGGTSEALAEQPYLIGSGDDCDLILTDAGIAPRHARLWPTKYGWLLTVEDGAIHAPGSPCAQRAIELRPGDCVRLADVCLALAVVERDAALPAMQTSAPAAAGQRRPDRSGLLMQLAATVVIVAFASVIWLRAGAGAPPAGSFVASGQRDGVGASVAAATSSPEQLREAFRSRLADAALSNRFTLTLGDRSWRMHAVLDDAEAPRFERVLWGFLSDYRVSFPVSASIVSAHTTLPFKIDQVISGANASLVLHGGRRVRVGETYLGVRLLAIKGTYLTFGGKRKIEVRW